MKKFWTNLTEFIKKNKKQSVIMGCCVLVFLICAGWLLFGFIGGIQSEQDLEEIKNQYVEVKPEPTSTPVPTEKPVEKTEDDIVATPEPAATPEPVNVVVDGINYPDFENYNVAERVIDFAGLQSEENEHIYAWITIPNTNIDYPILQHPEDPSFYLRRNTKKKSATAGCIFTELYNSKDFNDNMTVIYGHNMRNESMFHNLHYYEDADFLAENPYVYIYTEKDTRIYQIFAANEYTDAHLLLNADMQNDAVFGQYLDNLKSLNGSKDQFNWEIDVSSDDKIIVLSTCVRNEDEKRYLVHGKLVAIEENAEKATTEGDTADNMTENTTAE